MDVTTWHVSEYETVELSDFNGNFHVQDTYVIRWKYKVSLTGELNARIYRSGVNIEYR